MSRNASVFSSSYTLYEGSSPRIILQKMQPARPGSLMRVVYNTTMSDLVSGLLSKRGIVSAEDIDRFLNPVYERDTHSSFLLEGMDRAVARVLAAIQNDERI